MIRKGNQSVLSNSYFYKPTFFARNLPESILYNFHKVSCDRTNYLVMYKGNAHIHTHFNLYIAYNQIDAKFRKCFI